MKYLVLCLSLCGCSIYADKVTKGIPEGVSKFVDADVVCYVYNTQAISCLRER